MPKSLKAKSLTSRPRLIRVSSRALGPKHTVRVYVYDTVADMRVAAILWHPTHDAELSKALGVTQTWRDENGRCVQPIIRLCRPHLSADIVVHEIHHASAGLYGASLPNRISTRAHLNHYNERFAYLWSDLVGRLNDRLQKLGYYDES